MDFDHLEEKIDRFSNMPIKEKKKQKEIEKKALMRKLENGKSTWDIFCKDNELNELRKNKDVIRAMHKKFGEAYEKYIAGDWATAEDLLS